MGAQTCTWLAPLWVTLRTARGAGFDDLARKYYDVAKVADFGPPDGPPPGRPEYGHWRPVRLQSESPAHNGLF